MLDRKVGEYELPEGASLIACGNRETDRGVVHRMPTPLASRFVHLDIRVDAEDWLAWGAANGIAAEVLKVWRELPYPRAIVNDPENADIPKNAVSARHNLSKRRA